MKKGARKRPSIRSRRGGFIALLVVVLLAFFGLVAGLQVLLHASVGVSSRALEFRRQQLLLDRLCEQAAREAVLSQTDVPARTEAFADSLAGKLAALGLQEAVVLSCPSELPTPPSFPFAEATAEPLVEPSQGLLTLAGPELRYLAGGRVAEYRLSGFEFQVRRPVLGGEAQHKVSLEARLLSVPLARQGRVAYDLPSEIAASSLSGTAAPSDSLGLSPGRDGAAGAGLRARADAMPNHFRHKGSLSAAYQRLFSQSFIERVASLAGPTRFLDLDAAPAEAPVLDGLTRTAQGAVFDLGLAGHGSWNGVEDSGNCFLFTERTAGRVLALVDSVGRSDQAPLVLVVLGETPGGLVLELGNVSRPVVLVAFNATLRASAGTFFDGAVFLAPSCTLPPLGGRLDLAHLSYWGGAESVDWRSVHASLPLSFSLEELSPRATFVAVGPATP